MGISMCDAVTYTYQKCRLKNLNKHVYALKYGFTCLCLLSIKTLHEIKFIHSLL